MRTRLTTLVLFPLGSLAGQSPIGITGTVTNGATGKPLAGAVVQIRSEASAKPFTVVTGPDGSWRILLPAEGSWTWRVVAMGFAPSAETALNLGQTRARMIALRPLALRLPDVSTKSCAKSGMKDSYFADVITAARASLETSERTARAANLVFWYVGKHRTSGPGLRDSVWQDTTIAPFGRWPVPAGTVEQLRTTGFIGTVEDGARLWYGPTAEVLFDPWFIDSHCFRIVPETPRRIGNRTVQPSTVSVTFGDGPEGLTDIKGSFTIDKATLALTTISWEYVNLPPGIVGPATGRITLSKAGDGSWYPSGWTVMTPWQEVKRPGQAPGPTWQHHSATYKRFATMGADPDSLPRQR